MAEFTSLEVADTNTFDEILQQVDNRLVIVGTQPPQGNVAAGVVGQRYIDSSTRALYICTATDGTVSGTEWEDLEMEALMVSSAFGSF